MSRVYVTPHSLEASPLESTARTLLALHPIGAHVPQRDAKGNLLLDDSGRMIVESHDPHFLIFAVERQGYARKAELT